SFRAEQPPHAPRPGWRPGGLPPPNPTQRVYSVGRRSDRHARLRPVAAGAPAGEPVALREHQRLSERERLDRGPAGAPDHKRRAAQLPEHQRGLRWLALHEAKGVYVSWRRVIV